LILRELMPMNATVRHIPLMLGQNSDVVAAELRDRIEDHNLRDWQIRWLPILTSAGADHNAEESGRPVLFTPGGAALDWPDCVDTQRRLPGYRASFAIECEGTTQGMIAVRCESKRTLSSKLRGRGFIQIVLLESAPWNRGDLSESPRFRGIGRMLVVAAVAFSLSRGLEGRVGVFAFKGSTEFYEKCGMTDFGQDAKYPHLHLFAMTADEAEVFVAATFMRFHRLLSNQKSTLDKLGRGWSAIDRWFG
jgi:GNAT superfamily N-acetyltransferase